MEDVRGGEKGCKLGERRRGKYRSQNWLTKLCMPMTDVLMLYILCSSGWHSMHTASVSHRSSVSCPNLVLPPHWLSFEFHKQ